MVFLLYNKVLLRVLVGLTGLGIALVAWKYTALLASILGASGARDALAIVSFLIAGWLMMLIAEVVDHHYVRALGCLAALAGGVVSYKWIFLTDGPALREAEGGAQDMWLLSIAFAAAMLLALLMLILLVARLAVDRATHGRKLGSAKAEQEILRAAPKDAGQPAKPEGLPEIPIDTSPLDVSSQGETVSPAATPARAVGPVSKLVGVGGVHQGSEYALTPGEHTVGRQDADIELGGDNQVSRSHARISVADDGIATLIDAGSTNGSFVNNQRVDSIELAPGDLVRIGTNQFKVEA